MLPIDTRIFCSVLYGGSKPGAAGNFYRFWHGVVCASAGDGKIYDSAFGDGRSDPAGGMGKQKVQRVRGRGRRGCKRIPNCYGGGIATGQEPGNRMDWGIGIHPGLWDGGGAVPGTPLFFGRRDSGGSGGRRQADSPRAWREAADIFNGLSQIFSQMERFKNNFEPEEMGKMQQEIAGKICMSCSQCAICWQEESSPMYELFYRMFHSIEKRGSAEEEVHQELSGYCPYSDSIIEEAVGVFEKAKLNLSWYNRLLENRGVIAEQLDAMAYIMEDCAREYKDISGKEGRLLGAVKYRVKERGIVTKEMHLYERHNGKMSLQMRAVSKWGSCVPVKELAKAVSQGLRRDMVPGRYVRTMVGKDEAFLTFEEDTLFHTLQGVARLTKDNAQVSGDSFSFLELEGGECVMALSDGMGSGIRACKESEMVIELIEKFLEAGFKKETAIRMMNSAMVIQGEEGIFSTVDMAAMDLYTGMCEFYKIGAAATFIKRGGAVECISSGSLPAGMFHQLEIDRASRQLQDGDFVVQVTDGVLDDLHVPSPEETMEEILETIETNNPGQMAKQILERILLFTAGKVPDDMTVLVAGIWEK